MTMAFEKWMTRVKSYYSEELPHVKFMMKRVEKMWELTGFSKSQEKKTSNTAAECDDHLYLQATTATVQHMRLQWMQKCK